MKMCVYSIPAIGELSFVTVSDSCFSRHSFEYFMEPTKRGEK